MRPSRTASTILGHAACLITQALGKSSFWRLAMPPYRQIGSLPRKRHIEHRREPGYKGEGIYYEEVVTTAGFGRAYTICYHLRPPTRLPNVEPAGTVLLE